MYRGFRSRPESYSSPAQSGSVASNMYYDYEDTVPLTPLQAKIFAVGLLLYGVMVVYSLLVMFWPWR